MLIKDLYNIEVNIDGVDLEDPAAYFSFVIEDSIFDFFNQGKFYLPDDSGLVQETLGTMEGVPINIEFGINEKNTIESKHIIYNNRLVDMSNPYVAGGENETNLINNWYYEQNRSSKAYEDRISDVVKKLIQNANFSKTNINDTSNYSVWYQALKTEAEFMHKVLRKYAYSDNSENSPFYVFINSNNEFNFRNYYSMYSEKPVATLNYQADNKENSDNNTIRYIKPYSLGSEITRSFKKRNIYSYDENGTLQKEETKITDYFPSNNKIMMRGNPSTISGYTEIGTVENIKGLDQSKRATEINVTWESFGLQKMLVIAPFNPDLLAGRPINIEIATYAGKSKAEALSHVASTPWLIEKSQQIWNGKNQTALSRLIVSRKYSNVPGNYLAKDKLFS